MADSEKQGAFSGIKGAWANPKARKGILITAGLGGAVLVVTGLSMRDSKPQAATVPAAAAIAQPPVVRPDVTAKVTPQYQELVQKRDQQRADDAAKTQLEMALPQVAGLTPVTKEEPKPAAAPIAPPERQRAERPQPAPQVETQRQVDQEIRQAPGYAMAGAFMTEVAKNANYARAGQWTIVAAPQARGPQGGQGGQGAGSGGNQAGAVAPGGSSQAAPLPARVIIPAGSAVFATMDTAVNTDYSGPVVATIRQGPFANARLIGQKTLEWDAVVVRFNTLSLPTGGPAVPIQAYAINMGDVDKFGTTGMEGNVNYHGFQRYFLPALLAFTQTYGYAASVQGTTTTTGTTSTTQSTQPLSSRDRAIVAIGGAMAPIQADIARMAARPITVTMPANTEIGIIFATDVTDKAQERAAQQAAQGVSAGYEQPGAAPAGAAARTQPAAAPAAAAPTTGARTGLPGAQMMPTYTAPYAPPGTVFPGN